MFMEIWITGTHNNTGNGKDKYKDHNDNKRPAGKI